MRNELFHLSVCQPIALTNQRFQNRAVGRRRFRRRFLAACVWMAFGLTDGGSGMAQEGLFRKPQFSDSPAAEVSANSLRLGGAFQSSSSTQKAGLPGSAAVGNPQEKKSETGLPPFGFQPIYRNALPITGKPAGYSRSLVGSGTSQSRATGSEAGAALGNLANPEVGRGISGNSAWQDGQNEQYEEIVPESYPQTVRPGISLDSIQDSMEGNAGAREVVIQRYPNGNPQIERQVIQDENGNYLNDGYWKVYSESGNQNLIASGNYRLGKMHGIWMRKHSKDSSPLFQTAPFNLFEGPFVSFAMFQNNQLEGMWTIMDEGERKIFEMPYQDGQRSGTASWFYPSLNKMREVTFREGLIHGRLREWDEQKKLIRDEEFIDGRRLIRNVTYYRPQQPESETYFLDGQMKVVGTDNWWEAQPARINTEGQRVQHGPVNLWHDNGLPKMKGEYANGVRVGKFTWWYPSGTKQSEGGYQQGKKNGRWIWWHPNGMKASDGLFEDDSPADVWTWWDPQGQVIDRRTLGPSDQQEDGSGDAEDRRPQEGEAGFSSPLNSKEQDPFKKNPPVNDPGLNNPGPSESRSRLPLLLEELEDIQPLTSPQLPPIPSDQTNPGRTGADPGRRQGEPAPDSSADPFRIPTNLFEEKVGERAG